MGYFVWCLLEDFRGLLCLLPRAWCCSESSLRAAAFDSQLRCLSKWAACGVLLSSPGLCRKRYKGALSLGLSLLLDGL